MLLVGMPGAGSQPGQLTLQLPALDLPLGPWWPAGIASKRSSCQVAAT
jgi:hypothetical protein